MKRTDKYTCPLCDSTDVAQHPSGSVTCRKCGNSFVPRDI